MSQAPREDLERRDREAVWHPYAAMPATQPAFAVQDAEGVRLRLVDGREVIDGMASWWCVIHGYRHPQLVAAVQRQAEELAHVMFGGLTHEPAVRLADALLERAPAGLEHVFFSDSGSVSVEVALKMALQYWHGQGEPDRRRMLTVRHGYHGDTLGAMSVCDPDNGMHGLFRGVVPRQLFAPAPPAGFDRPLCADDLEEMERLLRAHREEVAAVILEPIVQGAGGMRFYAPAYLREVARLARAHGALLILDEIATGFGRTGRLFACEHAGVTPDVMCVGKALTGGLLTLAATLVTPRVAAGVCAAPPGLFMHGPTFMANPLACAAALASLELLRTTPWQARVAAIEAQLRDELEPLRGRPGVADVRVLGAIGVVELEDALELTEVQPFLVERGVWLRPFRRLLYTMPPYVIEPADLSRVTAAMAAVVQRFAS